MRWALIGCWRVAGFAAGCVSRARYETMLSVKRRLADARAVLAEYALPGSCWEARLGKQLYTNKHDRRT